MNEHPILSENEKLAMRVAGDTTTRIMTLDGKTAEDIIEERNINSFNKQVDSWNERFDKHSTNISEYAENMNNNIEKIEIMPIGNYLLVKEFVENPFQRIVRDSKSGLILDTGGFAPEYKNTDNGQIEEEEQYIKVAVVQETGPLTKFCQIGDTVFYAKPTATPVPFYKQNLKLVCENQIIAVVNEGLTERFNKIRNNGK